MTKHYLAIDIGASSGRHIVGWSQDGALHTEQVYRFPNGVKQENGHLVWSIEELETSVRAGIDEALKKFPGIESLSIDTWGVDYVLLKGDEPIMPCYAYRDERTAEAIDKLHSLIPFEELYAHTGIQYQPFNTVYQLYDDLLTGRLDEATDFLMIPTYLMYRLCGVKVHEYTNATTMGMISAATGTWDEYLIGKLGLPQRLFGAISAPGTQIGTYKGIRVLLCATHDTGSAVEGIPMEGDQLYISSGTWSLLGVKVPKPITDKGSMEANYSNEGGVGYTRYQKNIMGMWVVNRLRQELCPDRPFPEIVKAAGESTFDTIVDVNDQSFLAPQSMVAAFDAALGAKPAATADYFRCAFLSLADGYRIAIEQVERNIGRHCEKLYIVGGGAKNGLLNEMTEKATGKQVVALPIEATALGNLKIQMEADKQ